MPEVRPTVMRLKKPDDWIKRQLENLRRVGEDNYKVGIRFPKKDPIAAGIAAQDRYEEMMRKKEVLERRKIKLEATDINEWGGYADTIGAPRLVEGVTAREKEVRDFVTAWQPILLDHVDSIDKMPDVTDKDREDRMLANLRGLKAKKLAWLK